MYANFNTYVKSSHSTFTKKQPKSSRFVCKYYVHVRMYLLHIVPMYTYMHVYVST